MFIETPADDLLAPLAGTFCEERKSAVKNRAKLTGIWAKLREQYAGMDELNRGSSRQIEGASTLDGPISTIQERGREDRSTVFVNITRPYTNAGTARIADILFPASRLPFEIEATPVSEMDAIRELLAEHPELTESAMAIPELGMRLVRTPEENKVAVEGADRQVRDWLTECDWAGVGREQIEEAGKLGIGVVKAPFSKRQELSPDVEQFINMLPMTAPDPLSGETAQRKLENQLRYRPVAECVRPENCYPDFPHCGTDIQNGRFFFERVPETSERDLRELMEDDSYFPEQIQACLDEGPKNEKGEPKDKSGKKKHSFDLWIRTGDIRLSDLEEALEDDCRERLCGNDSRSGPIAFLSVEMCNDRIIRIVEPMLRKKVFPYWLFKWEPREGSWDGIGIVEAIETPQRGLNAAVRALMDNMGFAVGPQILYLAGKIEPVEGDAHKLHAYKWWQVLQDASGLDPVDDAKKAISLLEFPSYLPDIMPIIQYWLKMAEDTTGLPLLLQGQSSTDAVGVSNQMMNNTTTNLRLIIKRWDDKVCKPQVACFYDWSQDYGPDSIKGDAKVKAMGSSALIQKEIQQQATLQFLDRSVQPVFGISPKKLAAMYFEGHQMDAEMLQLTPEEEQQLQAAAEQPDPKVEVAQLETQATKYVADVRAEMDKLELAFKAQKEKLDYQKAMDVVDTQTTAQVAMAGMKEETKKAEAAAENVTPIKPEQPPEAPPEEDIDAQLDALGFVS